MLQLRKAAISAHDGHIEGSCGFCRYGAIKELQVNLRQASSSSVSSLDKSKGQLQTRNLSDNNQDNKGNDNQDNNNQKDQQQNQEQNKDQNQEQQQQSTQQKTSSTTTRTVVNEKTGAPTQFQEVDMSTDKSTEQVDEETRKRAKNKQASSSELLEAIERLSVENQNLKMKLQTAQSDNQTLRSVNDQFNTRLASLEQDRAQERAAIRKQQIESYVETAPAYKLLSAQARQAQVQNFVSGSMEIEEIKKIVEPLNESVSKTYGIQNRAASYRPQKLQLGTNERSIEVRSASVENKAPTNNTVDSNDNVLPHWAQLSQQFKAGRQNSNGGIQ